MYNIMYMYMVSINYMCIVHVCMDIIYFSALKNYTIDKSIIIATK